MAGAGAAPEILVITDLLVGLVFLLAFLVLLGILWTYRHTFGWLLGQLAAISIQIPIIHRRVHPFFLAGDFDHAFNKVIATGAAKTQAMSGRFFHAAAVVQGWIVRELKDLAVEMWGWANWLQRSHLPKWLKALIYAALPVLLLPRILKAIGHIDVPALYRRVRHLERGLQAQVLAWIKRYALYAIPGAIAIPGLLHDVRDFRKELAKLRLLRKRLWWLLSFGGVAALVAAGLRALGLGWARCSNVAKAGKAICRTNVKWLENALLGLTVIFGSVSLRVFAHQVGMLLGDGVGAIRKFWHADLRAVSLNPDLGETGGDPFFFQPADYVAPNPSLGDVA